MRDYGKITIRGISGWRDEPKCEAKDERGEQCRKAAGHDEHAFPQPRLSPEEALAKIKEAAREGNVMLATEMEPDRGGVAIAWEAENYGFGEITIWMDKDGAITIDDECSSREFLAALLKALLDQSKTVSEQAEKV